MSRQPANRSSLRGFTLIELLVTITIVAVLASLLGVGLFRAKQSANRAACLSNLQQLGVATQLFMQDYNGYMPDVNWWAAEILPYVGSPSPHEDIFWCPSATEEECPSVYGRALSKYDNNQLIPISYGLNGNFPCNSGQILYGNLGLREIPRRLIHVPSPESVVLYTDQAGGYANVYYNTRDRFSNRHGPSSDPNRMNLNAVFVDGHAEALNMEFDTTRPSPWRSMFDAVW